MFRYVRQIYNVGVLGAAAGVATLVLGAASMYNVDSGSNAIIFNRVTGMKAEVMVEGTHFCIPFIEKPIVYSVRTKPKEIPSLTGSKDLQMVRVTLRLLYFPVAKELPDIYCQLGIDYDEKVLPSIANEVLKAVIAQFNASQLITQRQQVSEMVKKQLTERARDFHIVIDDVAITELTFGTEYMAAVEAKQVAAQEAERAKFVVEKAREDKRSIIIRARGEAEVAKMITEACQKNPNFVILRQLEASRDIAKIIASGQNTVMLDANTLLLSSTDPKNKDKAGAH